MLVERTIEKDILASLFHGKVIIIFGARQTGKTTLLKSISNKVSQEFLWLSGDDVNVRQELGKHSISHLKAMIGRYKLVFIDEAQQINNIGLSLKIIVDHLPDVQVIATGSSSFDLANALNEPLTGRKFVYHLFPLSYEELVRYNGLIDEKGLLERRLVFGTYPEIALSAGFEEQLLYLLSGSYLYKDLFMLEKMKKPQLLEKLVQALALQIGSEVSFNEIAQLIGADIKTVERYIELLEKAFIVFRLGALSRNLRNEIKKSRKIYFYDNGIRNAVLGSFASMNARTDSGALWENYFISERLKYLKNQMQIKNTFFWRTHNQQEIDYIEERNAQFDAYEIKWNPIKKPSLPSTFSKAYPNHKYFIVNPDNFQEFLLKSE